MKSYSFELGEVEGSRYYTIWSEIQANRLYFRKFCGSEADEAMQTALVHSLKHFDENKGSLQGYIKALAKTLAYPDGRCICVDFLEQTLDDNDDEERRQLIKHDSDFSNELIDEMYLSIDRASEVADLALGNMDKFIILCKAIKSKNSSTVYYSEVFIRACLDLFKKCKNFNEVCLELYEEYGKEMEEFLSLDRDNIGNWCEADYTFLHSRKSRRVVLTNEFGGAIDDADNEEFYIKGSMKDKKIVRVWYKDVYENLLDLVDSPCTNEIKFVIGERYIIKTLGGSLSVCSPNLYNIYDLVQDEILTNLLKDMRNSSILNIGSECMYFLCKSNCDLDIPKRVIRGIPLEFKAEEVTLSES